MKNNIYFTKQNYYLIVGGLLLAIIGYVVMSGGNPEDPSDFSPDIFNFRRMTLAPIIILSGYVVVLFGIIKVFKKDIKSSEIDEKEAAPNKKKK